MKHYSLKAEKKTSRPTSYKLVDENEWKGITMCIPQFSIKSFMIVDFLDSLVAPVNDGGPFSGNVIANNGCTYKVYVSNKEVGEMVIGYRGEVIMHLFMVTKRMQPDPLCRERPFPFNGVPQLLSLTAPTVVFDENEHLQINPFYLDPHVGNVCCVVFLKEVPVQISREEQQERHDGNTTTVRFKKKKAKVIPMLIVESIHNRGVHLERAPRFLHETNFLRIGVS